MAVSWTYPPLADQSARRYLDPVTGKIYIAHMPDEIRKGGLFGADINAAVAFMKGGCNMSYTTIGQHQPQNQKAKNEHVYLLHQAHWERWGLFKIVIK